MAARCPARFLSEVVSSNLCVVQFGSGTGPGQRSPRSILPQQGQEPEALTRQMLHPTQMSQGRRASTARDKIPHLLLEAHFSQKEEKRTGASPFRKPADEGQRRQPR